MWEENPVMLPFKVAGRLGELPGRKGLPNARAGEVLSKYVIVDMYAKAVQGGTAEEAVAWAEGELKKVYV
jgi:multiple sugar transport system substrate-binding protein